MTAWHLITCEFPPMIGGVSDHSRVVAEMAAARGCVVHVWAPAGAKALPGVQVHDALRALSPSDLARARRLLLDTAGPRRIVVQWVPHGYGRRGVNLGFSRWIRALGASNELDVIVHEPFVDFLGGSWAQPARAVVQRYMARQVLRNARRIWVSIPGWAPRLERLYRGGAIAARVLPVPGTIPVDAAPDAVEAVRTSILKNGHCRVVGHFGGGGGYSERALEIAIPRLLDRRRDLAILCLGRGSDALADRLRRFSGAVVGTGAVAGATLSHYLQACDVMLQPYEDGVSGRRTTTITALEHGVPVATTVGRLSEAFWRDQAAVASVPAEQPADLARATASLLEDRHHLRARQAARTLYAERFHPGVALAPLFAEC